MVGWELALRDGVILSVMASGLVMGTLRANPRLLLRHYPAELRAAVPPATRRERLIGVAVGLVLIGLLIAAPAWSTAEWRAASGESRFVPLFLHAFIVGTVFNLTDWLLLDELWLGALRPRWAMLPGTDDVPFRYNHAQHARGFLVGSVFVALIAAITAGSLVRV